MLVGGCATLETTQSEGMSPSAAVKGPTKEVSEEVIRGEVKHPSNLRDPGLTFEVSTDQDIELWRRASVAIKKGEHGRGLRHLEEIVRGKHRTKEREKARLALAQSSLERHAHRRVLSLLDAPSVDHEFERLQTMALAYEGMEKYEEAAQVWLKAVQEAESAQRSGHARKGAARNLFLTGKTEQAVDTLEDAEKASLAPLVEEALHPTLLERLYKQVGKEDPWYAWLALRRARQFMREGNAVGAREAAEHSLKDSAGPQVRHEAREFMQRLVQWDKVEPKRVGVLMPLSGKYHKSVRGFKLAIELAFAKEPSLVPIFKDTAADPVQAAKAAEDLIFKDNVAVILGPVGNRETEAVVNVTRRYHIPHVHLSSKHELGLESKNVLRFRVSPYEYGALMARYAVEELGHKRFGLFCPTNSHGYAAMAGFWDEAVSLGAEVRAVEFFGAKLTKASEFNPLVGKLLHATEPGKVRVDFDALFVPGRASQMRTMVPLLKYWGVRIQTDPSVKGTAKRPLVQLLGSSGWHHRWLIDKGEDLLDNSVFATPFHYDPNDPYADDFVVRYQRASNKAPLPVHAEVYDAANLVVTALSGLQGESHETRRQMLQRLMQQGTIKGATGPYQLSLDGTIIRRPWLMTVDLDEIRPRLPILEEIERRSERGRVSEEP